jgi:hypothetical protein
MRLVGIRRRRITVLLGGAFSFGGAAVEESIPALSSWANYSRFSEEPLSDRILSYGIADTSGIDLDTADWSSGWANAWGSAAGRAVDILSDVYGPSEAEGSNSKQAPPAK